MSVFCPFAVDLYYRLEHVHFVLSYQHYSLKSSLDPDRLHSLEGSGRKSKLDTELLKARHALSKHASIESWQVNIDGSWEHELNQHVGRA